MQEERGITAGELVRLMKRRILWIVAIAALAALAAALFTALVYNRAREEYFLTFVVEFAQDETPFRYETVVYADNLEAARASDAAFAGIDTEHMAADEDIAITRAGGENAHPSYTVTVSGKYFSDRSQATKFLRAVVECAVAQAENAARGAFAPPRLLPAFLDLFPAFGEMRICAAGTAYGGTARVLYRQNTASVIDNGVSPLLAAIAGFIVAFLIAGLIFCAADYPAYRREKLARQQTEEGEPPKK